MSLKDIPLPYQRPYRGRKTLLSSAEAQARK